MTTTSIPVEDRMQILDLFARYCRGLDGQRREEFLGTFWEDGVLGSPLVGGDFTGHAGLDDFYDRIHGRSEFEGYRAGQHRTANVLFDEVTANRAVIWCQFQFLTRVGGIPQLSAYGEYHDVVTKRDGEWRFARRDICLAADALTPAIAR